MRSYRSVLVSNLISCHPPVAASNQRLSKPNTIQCHPPVPPCYNAIHHVILPHHRNIPCVGLGRHTTVPPCHQRRKAPVLIPTKILKRSHPIRVLLFGSFWSQLQIRTDAITSTMRIGAYHMRRHYLLIVNLRSALISVHINYNAW